MDAPKLPQTRRGIKARAGIPVGGSPLVVEDRCKGEVPRRNHRCRCRCRRLVHCSRVAALAVVVAAIARLSAVAAIGGLSTAVAVAAASLDGGSADRREQRFAAIPRIVLAVPRDERFVTAADIEAEADRREDRSVGAEDGCRRSKRAATGRFEQILAAGVQRGEAVEQRQADAQPQIVLRVIGEVGHEEWGDAIGP